jgi:hypothetical protein
MTDQTRLSVDGVPSDGVGHDLATVEHMAQFKEAGDALSRFRAPVLVYASNPHEKLFVVAFDGTGNNKFTNPLHATNVAKIYDQIEAANKAGNKQVFAHYEVGPGTQSNKLTATLDGMTGFSYEQHINNAYKVLIDRVEAWRHADPEAVIRLQSIGFSRGASQVAGFARLVHEKGIPDLKSRTFDAEGNLSYTRYHIAPGELVQTVGLFDPVATGVPMEFDRRLPPSVVSGFQITAANEYRALFPSDQIIPPGFSEDGRFLNVMVPGAHSDVGGGYLRDGLSVRCGNLMIDYCNSARDVPFLQKAYEPVDQRFNVIHRSTEGMSIYRMDLRESIRGELSGSNQRLVPAEATHAGPLPHGPQPADLTRGEGLALQNVESPATPLTPERPPVPPKSAEVMREAGRSVPFAPKVSRVLGAAAVVADGVHTGSKTSDLIHQGNAAGTRSEVLHFASRNVGAWAGAEATAAGMALALAPLGVELGPVGSGVAAVVGGLVGFVGGEKLADAYDNHRIYQQHDPQGRTWRYDPAQPDQGWTREIPPLPETPHGQRITADAALSSRLTYQASSTAVELAIAKAPPPRDPYSQPAQPGDTPSLRDAPWTRDPATQQWSRHVTDQILEHGLTSAHTETASPSRATQLHQAAEQTIQENVAYLPESIARRYQATYAQEGWAQHGPVPEAIKNALNVPEHQLAASDGHTYDRAADGAWSRPGMVYGTHPADLRTREELDATDRIASASRQESRAASMAQTAPTAAAPSLDHSAHPDHAMFKQAQAQVHALDAQHGRVPDQRSDNLAAALTVAAKAKGLKQIDTVAVSEDGSRAFAAHHAIPKALNWTAHVQTMEGLNTPVAQSTEAMTQVNATLEQRAQQQVHMQQQMQNQQAAQGPVMGL